jgi:hypothetical protein
MAANVVQNNQYVYVCPEIPFHQLASDEFIETFTAGFVTRRTKNMYDSYYSAKGCSFRAQNDAAAALRYAETHENNGNDKNNNANRNANAAARQHALDAHRYANEANRHAYLAHTADNNAREIYLAANIQNMEDDTVVDTEIAVAIANAALAAANAALAARHASIAAQNSRQLAAGVLGNNDKNVGTDTSFAVMNADFAQRLANNAVRVHQRANAVVAPVRIQN